MVRFFYVIKQYERAVQFPLVASARRHPLRSPAPESRPARNTSGAPNRGSRGGNAPADYEVLLLRTTRCVIRSSPAGATVDVPPRGPK
jgi:hypothetical protein